MFRATHECSQCPEAFFSRYSLVSHMRGHEPKSVRKSGGGGISVFTTKALVTSPDTARGSSIAASRYKASSSSTTVSNNGPILQQNPNGWSEQAEWDMNVTVSYSSVPESPIYRLSSNNDPVVPSADFRGPSVVNTNSTATIMSLGQSSPGLHAVFHRHDDEPIVSTSSMLSSSSSNGLLPFYADNNDHVHSNTVTKALSSSPSARKRKSIAGIVKRVKSESSSKVYECPTCFKTFQSYPGLRYHRNSMHEQNGQFKCTYCDKKFCQKSHLSRHETLHTGVKEYKCTYCEKNFRIKGNLQIHLRIHTGEKPYACTNCGKKFTQQQSAKAHEKLHLKYK